ncbi:hypothetical protein GCM10022403_066580 [Streptomyces coacervatus]|uniref:Uncharacterized protein n=1 Tax=Streptomyces coacervatus TaxID=647381 RepID=A0ABP7IQD1_9ACTN
MCFSRGAVEVTGAIEVIGAIESIRVIDLIRVIEGVQRIAGEFGEYEERRSPRVTGDGALSVGRKYRPGGHGAGVASHR